MTELHNNLKFVILNLIVIIVSC